jgi:hypothetical protein
MMPKEAILTENDEKFVEVGWSPFPAGSVQIGVGLEDEDNMSWYADLNRDQVNQVIRNLRKARDRAFGADA